MKAIHKYYISIVLLIAIITFIIFLLVWEFKPTKPVSQFDKFKRALVEKDSIDDDGADGDTLLINHSEIPGK